MHEISAAAWRPLQTPDALCEDESMFCAMAKLHSVSLFSDCEPPSFSAHRCARRQDRAQREATCLARLDHPNVVRYYQVRTRMWCFADAVRA
eukprot:5869535-Pleurochrysis_carterae.AAC.1